MSVWGIAPKSKLCYTSGCSNQITAGDACVIHEVTGFLACKECGDKYGKKAWGMVDNDVHPSAPQTPITLTSFSYKFGKPSNAAKVIDTRTAVRNPWRRAELRKLTGLDPRVQEFVGHCKGAKDLLYTAARRVELGFQSIAFGCQGGKHRSVALVEMLAKQLREDGRNVVVVHRDLKVKAKEKVDGSTASDPKSTVEVISV